MNKKRRLIIAGVWKMNKTVAEARDLVCDWMARWCVAHRA
jgi:triosephosphate isomerase